MAETTVPESLTCCHCGTYAGNDPVLSKGQVFCCEGCRTVFDILDQNQLCEYYQIDKNAAISQKSRTETGWTLEELNLMMQEFVLHEDEDTATVLLHIPSMHCSSCIWLLEKLGDIDKGILFSRADFIKKSLRIRLSKNITNFGQVVILLKKLGYEPSLFPENDNLSEKAANKKTLLKLGVAGFCAGNIMMFSFPAYFGLNDSDGFTGLFGAINILLSLPLVLYSAGEYLQAAKNWIRYRNLSVKVPLAIGISALWLRSIYEVAAEVGPGYFDSLAGLVFFLLIGSWLQNRAFDSIRFGEKASRFFPLVAKTIVDGNIVPKKVSELLPGDRIRVKYGEVVPADGILLFSDAVIQYAFATGESTPQEKVAGEFIMGGGKNAGESFEMEVTQPFNSSRIAGIWNTESQNDNRDTTPKYEKVISAYFIGVTIIVALSALIFWLPSNQPRAWFAFTAVLMVACPCALALAPPFTFNTIAGYFARKGLYLRKPEVVGTLGETELIVLDKTGTLTDTESMNVTVPDTFSAEDLKLLKTICGQSNHPYSKAIYIALPDVGEYKVEAFLNKPGKGTQCFVNGHRLRLGLKSWVDEQNKVTFASNGKYIWFSIDDFLQAPVLLADSFRSDLFNTLSGLKQQGIELFLASGDESHNASGFKSQFGGVFTDIRFELSPLQKSAFIDELRKANQGRVLMVGDGINDAAALKEGDAGMVVAENTGDFFPEASSIILHSAFYRIPDFIRLAKKANRIVKEAFIVSLIYNVAALSLAFTGAMSPVIAAILMPSSSVALMFYAWARSKAMVMKEDKG